MAASTNTDAKNLTVWFNGMPSADLQSTSDNLGNLTYWNGGFPYVMLYPTEATTTQNSFMPFFWGIG